MCDVVGMGNVEAEAGGGAAAGDTREGEGGEPGPGASSLCGRKGFATAARATACGTVICSDDARGYTSCFHRHMRTHGSSTPTRNSNDCHTTSYLLIDIVLLGNRNRVIDDFLHEH